ncbi:hypothetical protein P175DRAFT_0536564 [Aspergillus ochraceoroseus IBT 24754]|uniref:Uncharacterized protein n=3 Tax=Aspergillus ochraceoroseus IBT 24754 TaxID=1392256 RepID=A0A2T5LKJ5_9EURO|nr:hypothetical protein P175DRAFT_0536564 [Aspergillus ochraceoroseus IBT 24754]
MEVESAKECVTTHGRMNYPFVVSDERVFRHLNLAFGSSRIASSAYQKWPTSCFNPNASNHSLYLIKLIRVTAILRETSAGTSYQMNRCEPPPEFPLASPYSGIVHHLSGPHSYAPTQIHPKTSGSVDDVRLLGPCFKTGRLRPLRQRPCRSAFLGPGWPHCTPGYKTTPKGDTFRGPLTDRPNRRWPTHGEVHRHECRGNPAGESGRKRFPFNNFTCCLTLFSKCFSSFDHSTCALSVSGRALRRGPHPKHPLQITTRTPGGPDFKFELLPLHSPLLGQSRLVSFPPLIDMLKFSGYPYLIRAPASPEERVTKPHTLEDRTRCRRCLSGPSPGRTGRDDDPTHKPGLMGSNDARTGMPPGIPGGAMCVQRLDDSLNSAIHITYRSSLRSSSMPEPRDPLLKVLTDWYQSHSDSISLRQGSCWGLPAGEPAEATGSSRHGWEVWAPGGTLTR